MKKLPTTSIKTENDIKLEVIDHEHEDANVPIKSKRKKMSKKKLKTKSKLQNIQQFNDPGITQGRCDCIFCFRVLSSSAHLVDHIRTHTLERPFVCKECSKSFVAPSNLLNHMRTHSEVKHYECRHCDRRFNTSSNRWQHEKIHLKKPERRPAKIRSNLNLISSQLMRNKSKNQGKTKKVTTSTSLPQISKSSTSKSKKHDLKTVKTVKKTDPKINTKKVTAKKPSVPQIEAGHETSTPKSKSKLTKTQKEKTVRKTVKMGEKARGQPKTTKAKKKPEIKLEQEHEIKMEPDDDHDDDDDDEPQEEIVEIVREKIRFDEEFTVNYNINNNNNNNYNYVNGEKKPGLNFLLTKDDMKFMEEMCILQPQPLSTGDPHPQQTNYYYF